MFSHLGFSEMTLRTPHLRRNEVCEMRIIFFPTEKIIHSHEVASESLITAMCITRPSGMLTTGHKRSNNNQAAVTVDQPRCGSKCCSQRLWPPRFLDQHLHPELGPGRWFMTTPTGRQSHTGMTPVLVASLTQERPSTRAVLAVKIAFAVRKRDPHPCSEGPSVAAVIISFPFSSDPSGGPAPSPSPVHSSLCWSLVSNLRPSPWVEMDFSLPLCQVVFVSVSGASACETYDCKLTFGMLSGFFWTVPWVCVRNPGVGVLFTVHRPTKITPMVQNANPLLPCSFSTCSLCCFRTSRIPLVRTINGTWSRSRYATVCEDILLE